MGFGGAVKSVFSKYFTLSGRAQRSEYWWWILFTILIGAVLWILDTIFKLKYGSSTWTINVNGDSTQTDGPKPGVLSSLWALVIFIPTITVQVRRLHDSGRTGWWWWLNVICCIGGLILFVFMVIPSQPSENKYGPQPS